MLQPSTHQSEARRLTDVLRAASEHGETFQDRGTVEERADTLQLVLEGGVLRQRFFADGRRHTVAIYYRDDVINLMGFVERGRKNTDYLMALKGAVIGYVPNATVAEIRAMAPSGFDGVSVLIYRELGMAQERTVSLAQRTAVERMAHFFCETLVRCSRPGSNDRLSRCTLHLSQELLATILGLSSVHVNRTLQHLRRLKLADIVHNQLIVDDFDRLAEVAEFDPASLARI